MVGTQPVNGYVGVLLINNNTRKLDDLQYKDATTIGKDHGYGGNNTTTNDGRGCLNAGKVVPGRAYTFWVR